MEQAAAALVGAAPEARRQAEEGLRTLQNTADLYSFSVTQGAQALTVVLNRKASAQTVTQAKVMKDLLSGVSAASFAVPAYGALILQ